MNRALYFAIVMTPLSIAMAALTSSIGVHGWRSWAFPILLSAAFFGGYYAPVRRTINGRAGE